MSIQRISVFPLSGAMLYPGLRLPDALARDRRIGMIQPRAEVLKRPEDETPLFDVGCLGHIEEVEALEDGRFNILLEGVARFRTLRELTVTTPFRQVEAELLPEREDETLASVERALFEREARAFADAQGYRVNWDEVIRLDDISLINGVSQIAPFDAASKQALLEADGVSDRCRLLVQLMQFYGRRDGDEGLATLQ